MAQTSESNLDALALAEQEQLTKRKEELEIELSLINKRLRRISRYFEDDAQQVKLTPPEPGQKSIARGEVRKRVLEQIQSHDGITTSELNAALEGISPHSIQNALKALRDKQEIIKDEGKGGKYRLASTATAAAEALDSTFAPPGAHSP